MLVRRARDRAAHRHRKKVTGGLKQSGEELVRILDALANEIWMLAETPPPDREAVYRFDRKIEAEWLGER